MLISCYLALTREQRYQKGGKNLDKPGRPLGLSIAIIFSMVLYSLMPLAQAAFILSLRQQFAAVEFLENGVAVGGAIDGFDDTRLLLSIIMGLFLFVICIMTWRGKPPTIRYIFVGAVILVTLVTIGWAFVSTTNGATLEQGIDSSQALMASLMKIQIVISSLIALYVVWYVNRAPARAFFRGYYLPAPEDTSR